MMRVSIERLRVWLLAGAGLLVIVIAGFLEYAHLRAHRFIRDLPGRLGMDITRESNGFTLSQSSQGKTVYTIHAAKMVQHKDGKTTLRDVGIVLYGQQGDRADRIYGSEFEYDQQTGMVRAVGVVHLDLQAPAPTDARGRAAYAAGADTAGSATASGVGRPDADDRMVHVTTSGLVFVQKLGAASTDQEIEFQYQGLTGRAKGADYNSDTGMTVLQSDVHISGLRDGQPVSLTAAHAEMDRGKEQLLLLHARYLAMAEGGAAIAKDRDRTATAEQAVIHLRQNGSVERVLASGGVSLEQAGGVLKARDADVAVSAESRPETVHLSGGLTYTEDGALREVRGRAGQGTARFDRAGRVESAAMSESAEMHTRGRAAGATAWNERTVSGDRIDMRFATAEGNKLWLHNGTATGAAQMILVDREAKAGRSQERTSELHGDTLTAQMLWDGRAARLSHVSGVGHTTLRQSDLTGAVDTSAGQMLDVSFEAPANGAGKRATDAGAAASISRAVERGDVTLTHLPGRRPVDKTAPELMRATAWQATFEGDRQMLTLSGQAQVTEGDSLLRAETVTMRRDSGDATAEGGVRASYRQAGSAEPLHVMSARVEFKHDAGIATFYGSSAAEARLWQGGSQVEAPVIEFSQTKKTLVANASGTGELVRTVLVSGDGKNGAGGGRDRPQVMRVSSRSLRYSDAERRAQFGGGVVLQDADGTMRAPEVVALLKAAAAAGSPGAASSTERQAGFMGGSVDRVTADGGVEVSEPGRRATGERMVYTASDGMSVMTGTPSAPPKVVDEAQGTITGAVLQFHAGDNTVMVLGDTVVGNPVAGGTKAEGRRVHTETRVRRQPR